MRHHFIGLSVSVQRFYNIKQVSLVINRQILFASLETSKDSSLGKVDLASTHHAHLTWTSYLDILQVI